MPGLREALRFLSNAGFFLAMSLSQSCVIIKKKSYVILPNKVPREDDNSKSRKEIHIIYLMQVIYFPYIS